MKDIELLEKTFKFRPICLRNMRISNILLIKGVEAGLNLAQIGEILCRPDDDPTAPSILEGLVKSARLITDAMYNYQSKIKDTNLRSIDYQDGKTSKNDSGLWEKQPARNRLGSFAEDDEDSMMFGRKKLNGGTGCFMNSI